MQTKTLIQRFENSTAVEGGGGGGGEGELSTNSAHVHATKAILPPINNNSGNEDNTPRVLVVDDNKFCRQLLLDQVQSCFVPFCHVDGVGDSAPTALQHMLTSDVEYDLGNFFCWGIFDTKHQHPHFFYTDVQFVTHTATLLFVNYTTAQY